MSNDAISQAEIDALIQGLVGASEVPPSEPVESTEDPTLLMEALDALAVQAGRALSDMTGLLCVGGLADVTTTTERKAYGLITGELLIGRTALTSGLVGAMHYVLPRQLGQAIAQHITVTDAPEDEEQAFLRAVGDALAEMNRLGLIPVSEVLGRPVIGGPVEVVTAPPTEDEETNADVSVVVAYLDLSVGDKAGQLLLVIPREVAARIEQAVKVQRESQPAPVEPTPVPEAPAARTAEEEPGRRTPTAPGAHDVAVAPVAWTPPCHTERIERFSHGAMRNIDLLMNVRLTVTVELGRIRRRVRDVLSLAPGAVLELDRLAGDLADVRVNGKLIARGEVVVTDENYGVRITDIASPAHRAQSIA